MLANVPGPCSRRPPFIVSPSSLPTLPPGGVPPRERPGTGHWYPIQPAYAEWPPLWGPTISLRLEVEGILPIPEQAVRVKLLGHSVTERQIGIERQTGQRTIHEFVRDVVAQEHPVISHDARAYGRVEHVVQLLVGDRPNVREIHGDHHFRLRVALHLPVAVQHVHQAGPQVQGLLPHFLRIDNDHPLGHRRQCNLSKPLQRREGRDR
jgi:hypothetical protein